MDGRRWPLHPQPGEWEGLEGYISRLARAYGVGYDVFLRRALGRRGPGARNLDADLEAVLARLSAGTGVPVERLRAMTGWQPMLRLARRGRGWLETPEGRAALDAARPTLARVLRRIGTGGGS